MNKSLFFSFFLPCIMLYGYSYAQDSTISYIKGKGDINKSDNTSMSSGSVVNEGNINQYNISSSVTTHFVSPEPIVYVDISAQNVEGDLPEKNILRLKPDSAAYADGGSFQVTIVTHSFIAVYRLTCKNRSDGSQNSYVITVNPTAALQTSGANYIGPQEFERLCMRALSRKRGIKNVSSRKSGMELWTNNVFIVGNYLVFDIGAKNKTHLQYDVDQLRFTLKDKYSVNAAVSQDIELQPVYQLYPTEGAVIDRRWRNLLVFRKFTYPNNKVFHVEINETQISGRKVEMNIDYNQVLNAQFLQ